MKTEEQKPSNPTIQEGWTLRDEFANSVLQGKMTSEYIGFQSYEGIAEECYNIADAMLKQRNL